MSGILLAWVALRALCERTARVLPDLPLVVPVKPKLGENRCHLTRLPVVELHPNPFADDFGDVEKAGRFLLQQCNNTLGAQLAIRAATREIDRW